METAQHVILFVIIISNNHSRGLFSLFEGLLEESFAACLRHAAYLPEEFAVFSPLLQLLQDVGTSAEGFPLPFVL